MNPVQSINRDVLVTMVLALVLVFVGYGLGYAVQGAALAELRQTHAETARLQALAAARGLQDAQARSNALSADLLGREAQIDQLTREKTHAINRLTTGRACLGAAAVRVLNSAADTAPAGLEPVPETPSGAAATGGAFATDADVGHWAATAREQHEICRARLAALIDWHTAAPALKDDVRTRP